MIPHRPQMIRLLTLASVLTVASGCASSRLPASPPATLAEVNTVLGERWATVELATGETVGAESVHIGPETSTYVVRSTGETDTVRTGDIRQVSLRGPSGARTGAALGAAPGLFLLGVGIAASAGDAESGGQLAAAIITVVSVPVTIAGTAVGALGGAVLAPGRLVPIYIGPVSRYESPPP